MKSYLLAACLALPLTVLPLAASAGGFAGLDYVSSEVERGNRGSADPSALQFKFGTWINHNETLGGELRLGLGVSSDNRRGDVDVKINRYYGAYFRAQFPNTLPVRPYALLGVSRIETTEKYPNNGGSSSRNYSDLSVGLGADLTVTDVVFLSLEYLRAVDRSGDEVHNLSVGINGRF